MGSRNVGWAADQLQRWQAVYAAWLWIKPYLLPLVSGPLLGAWTARITHWPLPVVLIVSIAGIAAVQWMLHQFRRAKSRTNDVGDPLVRVISNDLVSASGFRFYASRETLHKHQPISKQTEGAQVIWAWWHTGMQADTYNAFDTGKFKRLLLPDPQVPSFKSLCAAVDKSPEGLREQIKQVTASAKLHHVEVRWTAIQTGNTMMIGDPESVNGWIHAEMVFAHTQAQRRPSFRIGRQEFSGLFRHLKEAYETAWNAATKQ